MRRTAGARARVGVGVRDNAVMRPSPTGSQPQEYEVPAWVTDLVPVADLARSHLVAALPTAGAVLLACAVVTSTVTGAVGLAAVLLPLFGAAGLLLAGVFTGRLGRRAAPSGTPSAPTASAAEPTASLRPGARTLAALLVLDIVGTALGLVVLGLAVLRQTDGALTVAALVTGALLCVGALGVLADERCPRRGRWLGCSGAGALLVLLGCGAVLSGGRGLWWLVGVLVLGADAVGVLALRAGRRRDAHGPTA